MVALTRALVLVLLLSGCGSTMRARGFGPAQSTMDELRSSVDSRRVALVVGVDSYDDPGIEQLRFAVSDAQAIAAHLSAAEQDGGAGFGRVTLLTGAAATRGAVLAAARSLGADLRKQDVFVLYFSGHGLAELSGDVPSLHLLAPDTAKDDLVTTAIDLGALRAWLGSLTAQRKALIVDACFSGEGKSTRGVAPPESVGASLTSAQGPDPSVLGSGEAHLFATTLSRPAFEDDGFGGGVYTHFLLGAMTWGRETADRDGDEVVTAWEAHDFARGRTMDHTDGAQVPEATLRVVGWNDVVLAGDPSARRQRDEALVFDYGTQDKRYAGATLYVDGRARGVFPGTVSVPDGVHRFEVRDAEGETLLAGEEDLGATARLNLPDLAVRLRRDRVLQSARVALLASPGEAWGEVWGLGALGGEIEGILRVPDGPLRGLVFVGVLGVGAPLAAAERPRPVLWSALGAGWGADIGRVRLRGSWQVRALGLPRTMEAPSGAPGKDGLLVFGTGPGLHAGFILDQHAAVMLSAVGQGAVVDLRGTGTPALSVWGTASAGVEIGF